MSDEKEEIIESQEDTEEKNEELEEEGSKTEEDGGEEEEEIDLEKITPETRQQMKEKSDTEEDEEEIDPEDKKRISKIVQKEVGVKIAEIENKTEVQAFITAQPEYAKYQGAILKYMSHPAYANIPVHNIAAIVASKDLMKMGAAKEREAQKKVQETKDGGTTIRKPEGGKKDWHTASQKDFEEQKAKVLGRQGY